MRDATAAGPRTSRRAAALLVAGGLLAGALAGEAAARLFLRPWWEAARLEAQLDRGNFKALIALDDDPAVMYGLRRNLDTRFQESRVVTDAEGRRVDPSEAGERPGAIRIALVGDSTPFGWRVEYADAYGARVRAALERRAGRPVSLRNFAVPGYNASQERRVFERRAAAFTPDVVIVHHDHNDAQPTGWGVFGFLPSSYGDNALGSALWKLTLRQAEHLRQRAVYRTSDPGGARLGEYWIAGPSYDDMLRDRRALLDAIVARGAVPLLVLFDWDMPADPAYRESREFQALDGPAERRFREMGYHVLTLADAYQTAMRDAGLRDMRAFQIGDSDPHPNARGHALIADALTRFIQETPPVSRLFASSGAARP